MKGFARVFEAIIASIMLIATLTFFFSHEPSTSGWDSATLQMTTQDVLESAYLNGTIAGLAQKNDKASLNNYIVQMLPRTVDFSIQIRGIPNDVIRIACVDCSNANMTELANILNPLDFQYHNRPISIRIENISLGLNEIKEDTDILFFFDKQKIGNYENKIKEFLSSGGSIYLLSDLSSGDTGGLIGSLFNLTGTGSSSQAARISDPYGGWNISHNVAKYYANLSSINIGDLSDTFQFSANGISAINDDRNIAVGSTDSSKAYIRANHNAWQNLGRTVWSADYNRADHNASATKKADKLEKASIMWASGESYSMDVAKKETAPVHFKSGLIIFDKDTYIFELIVWRAFF
jgi:hypothetical protein